MLFISTTSLKEVMEMVKPESNLPIKSKLNTNENKKTPPQKKLENKHINKFELTVRLHEDPVQTKMKALVAGGVEIDASSAKCQWEGLNYSTLSVNNLWIVTEFLKLRKDDEIKIKGSVFNQLKN